MAATAAGVRGQEASSCCVPGGRDRPRLRRDAFGTASVRLGLEIGGRLLGPVSNCRLSTVEQRAILVLSSVVDESSIS